MPSRSARPRPARSQPARAASPQGFTLIEVLVAFVIAAASLAVLTRVSGGATASVRAAGQYDEAVARAQSHMAIAAALPLVPSDRQGDEAGGFHWRVRIADAATAQAAPQLRPGLAGTLTLYRITVAISWAEGRRQRAVELDSAQLALAQSDPAQ